DLEEESMHHPDAESKVINYVDGHDTDIGVDQSEVPSENIDREREYHRRSHTCAQHHEQESFLVLAPHMRQSVATENGQDHNKRRGDDRDDEAVHECMRERPVEHLDERAPVRGAEPVY